jgi:predicted membrane-bound spermidine synthase
MAFCFLFVSGMAGLIYEIVWARYLALFLGHTQYAVVSVLVAFMGGLALGNFWLGQLSDRARTPLGIYAWLEIGLGAYALAFPAYYSFCHRLFIYLARSWQPAGATMLALKFAFSLFAILLPTVLMGGTLPVLARFVTRCLDELRAQVAALYAMNCAGAVAGCLAADFWLIPTWGLKLTLYCAAAMNLAVGLTALILHLSSRPGAASEATTSLVPGAEQFSPKSFRLALIGIGVSGFVAMLYEVAWTRLLALVLGSSTHAFSLMLLTLIAGISMGAWVINRWKTLRRILDAFAWAEIALALALLSSMFLYQHLPFWFANIAALLARRPEAYPLYELAQALICFGVMIVPAVCLGLTLPLVSRVATPEVSQTGGAVGRVFAINTLGTLLGAAITGLWLMPWLGLARTFALGAAANALVGAAILGRAQEKSQKTLLVLSPFFLAGVVWLAGRWFQDWPEILTLGLWRIESNSPSSENIRQTTRSYHLDFYRDGAGSTVSVNSFTGASGGRYLTLKINGKADASTLVPDMSTQLMLGHTPMLLRPNSQSALVIGLGSGITCGAIAAHPSIRRLDAAEISPDVAQAARLFASENRRVLNDPRFHLFVEDAKSFLQTTPQTYDLIVSEPSNPWMAGVAGVFSREFYESCRSRLCPGGLMTQWFHLYDNSDETVEIILHTFVTVFPHTSVWRGSINDMMLIGSTEPYQVDLAALEARFHHPDVEADLARIKISRVPVLLANEVISQENAAFIPSPRSPCHSDLHPILEYLAQKAFFLHGKAERWREFDETGSPRATTLLAKYLQTHPLTAPDFQGFTIFYSIYGLPPIRVYRSLLSRWHQQEPDALDPIELAVQLPRTELSPDLEVQRLAHIRNVIWRQAETDPTYLGMYRKFLLLDYRDQVSVFYTPPVNELEEVLARLIQTDPAHQRVYKLELAQLAWDSGKDDACLQIGLSALDPSAPGTADFDLDPQVPAEISAHMAEMAMRRGMPQEALRICRLATEARYTSPLLEMTQRKLTAQVNRAGR